ncbi:AAA family ATPase [Enterococcus olivae]
MAKLIIIRGNSGSGKSTIASKLQQHFGLKTMLLAQDVIRREIVRVKDGQNNLAIDLIKKMAEYGSQHCEVVIIEGILYTEWYGKMLSELFINFESVHAFYYDVSFEETLKRHQTKSNHKDFSIEDMKRWWKTNDILDIKNEKIIHEEMTIEESFSFILESFDQ